MSERSDHAEVHAIAHIHGPQDMSPKAKRDAERLLRQIPPDTRGLTARICGDPLPGRSAKDRKLGLSDGSGYCKVTGETSSE